MTYKIPAHHFAEMTLTGSKKRNNPWEEISVTAVMTGPDVVFRIPAFWDGDSTWQVRLTAAVPGTYQIKTECSDPTDEGLHNQQALLEVSDPQSENPLYRHGAIRISSKGDYFEHTDGTPWSWLGDAWWWLMADRVSPEGFTKIVTHRAKQGFNLAQIVVGFTEQIDGKDENAGGPPWQPGYTQINPKYFQSCDSKILQMVENGIVPCIVGMWGFDSIFMGREKTLSHWKYLVARYGALPVIWCLAGEAAMPFYLDKGTPDAVRNTNELKTTWAMAAYTVKKFDPWRRPVTLHPRARAWDDIDDPTALDFFMLQSGHSVRADDHQTETLAVGRDRFPGKIIVNGEPPFEGLGGTNWCDVHSRSYWSCMLSGGRGYTYGAAGLWAGHDPKNPVGSRADGGTYDGVYWDEALMYPGADQVAAGHRLLTSLPFHRFAPHPEWVEVPLPANPQHYYPTWRTFAAGIPGECRLIYVPHRWYIWDGPLVKHLEPGVKYQAAYLDTTNMTRCEAGEAIGDKDGNWKAPTIPWMHDWLLLLQRI